MARQIRISMHINPPTKPQESFNKNTTKLSGASKDHRLTAVASQNNSIQALINLLNYDKNIIT